MSSKRWFLWPLPFGDKCDPQCENDLHNTYCFVFPALAVVLVLAMVGFLRGVFTFEFTSRYSLDYQSAMIFSLIVFLIFFLATSKYQRKITMYFWCRRCPGPKEKNSGKRFGWEYTV